MVPAPWRIAVVVVERFGHPGRMAFEGFTADERAWLSSQRLGRLATVAPDGTVGNAPVTFFLRADDTIDIGGMRMGETKKFRNVEAGSRRGVRCRHRRHVCRVASDLPRDPRHSGDDA